MTVSHRRSASFRIDRRHLVRLAGAMALGGGALTRPVAAQDATPDASPHDHAPGADRMPPEIRWTWSADGVEITGEITSGWNRVIVENGRDLGVHVLTAKLPDDITDEQMQILQEPDGPMPDWLLTQHFPGIPDHVEPGQTVSGYTWYDEGRYFWVELWSGVTGELTVGPGSATRHLPAADVVVTMVEMTFLGLEEPIPAGPALWQIDNRGATWHEIMVARVPDGMTADEILEGLMAESLPTDDGAGPVGGYAITSPGFTGYVDLDLSPGSYAALCFAPDEWAGPPHALMGMITTFTVE